MAELPTGAFIPRGTFAMIGFPDGTNHLLIDITVSEDHMFESEVTDYPTESGSTFTDNIRKRPIMVSMQGIVSNTPLEAMRTIRGNKASVAAQEAYAHLQLVWSRGEPVTIRTSLGTFRNMAMESLSAPRSKDDGDAFHFHARFKQITIVTNARVAIKRTSTRGSGNKTSRGTQPLTGLDAKVAQWRKGITIVNKTVFPLGGSQLIGPTEFIRFIPNEQLPLGLGDDEETGGRWIHDDGVTPLDAEELERFKLDLARDTNSGRIKTTSTPVPAWAFDAYPKKAKRPIDLNAYNKKRPPLLDPNSRFRGSAL